jgi:hypothetical protein
VAGSLKRRLSRIRELGISAASNQNSRRPQIEVHCDELDQSIASRTETPTFLETWEHESEYVWTRELIKPDPLPEVIDITPFACTCATLRSSLYSEPKSSSQSLQGLIETRRLLFFDLETTGLSGGTGTLAFLAAIARRDDKALVVRQYFLADYPGEGDYLDAVLRHFDDESVVVTYNGSSFDLPLLRTRCVMNGRRPPVTMHLDALFAARRLWKRVYGGASLGMLERMLLEREREEDVPGALIPSLYFSYLRKGDETLMNAVMTHNADDVATLAALLSRSSSIFEDPVAQCSSTNLDRAGLGRILIAAGRLEEGEKLLEAALSDGDEAAGLVLSKLYRRGGRYEDWDRVVTMLPDTYKSDIERARFFERCKGDLESALAWARKARRLAPTGAQAQRLDIRIARLKKKKNGKQGYKG